MAGLDFVFGNRFALRLVGEFAQIGFAFTGTGDDGEQARRRPDDQGRRRRGGSLHRRRSDVRRAVLQPAPVRRSGGVAVRAASWSSRTPSARRSARLQRLVGATLCPVEVVETSMR